MNPFVKKLALVLFLAVSLYSSARYLVETIQTWEPGLAMNDGVYDWDERLSELRELLPPDVKVVGYVSEWDISPKFNYPDNETEYVLTQYVMAPVIVSRESNRQWVIVNLTPKNFKTWLSTQPVDVAVTKFPKGLYLVRRP